jgi:hypothetical protein
VENSWDYGENEWPIHNPNHSVRIDPKNDAEIGKNTWNTNLRVGFTKDLIADEIVDERE